jgi:hypothetical protein
VLGVALHGLTYWSHYAKPTRRLSPTDGLRHFSFAEPFLEFSAHKMIEKYARNSSALKRIYYFCTYVTIIQNQHIARKHVTRCA